MNLGFILLVCLALLLAAAIQSEGLFAQLLNNGYKSLLALGILQFLNMVAIARKDFKGYCLQNLTYLFGIALGIGFQAVDDVLGIWGDAETTGKPVGNDLREQKKSMPIAIAFDRGGEIGQAVLDAFSEPMSDSQIAALATRLESAGIRDQVQSIARDYLDQAISTLDTVDLAPVAKAELIELANFIWERDN